ncbi:MAG: Fe-S cluster assembly protein SufB [DPANN group archaeon]|nr:Fe-S cluster assembly protein SufB [DPANN group archaeon]
MAVKKSLFRNDATKYGFSKQEHHVARTGPGITEEIVREISAFKKEPSWMLDFRLSSLKEFLRRPLPAWGADLSSIDFSRLTYYLKPTDKIADDWKDVPPDILETFERLGVPEAERKFLAGVGAQYDSEMIYHKTKKELEDKGVIFCDIDTALKKHPDLFRKYFATVVPPDDNKLAALNSSVWSGGSFVYVPKGVKIDFPLQAYFRINAQNMGQFERTLIIAGEGASVQYIEGCTAPNYSTASLHAGVVELIAHKDAYIRYTTIQNWSTNVYNLVTQRAIAHQGAKVEWVDGNLGSRLTMKYPAVVMVGEGASAEILSIALAGKGQHQDAGAKVIHLAPNTSSKITNKSISLDGGKTVYRGLVKVSKDAKNVTASVNCDALILDPESSSDTLPSMDIANDRVSIGHEASVGKISDDDLFYLMSRGLSREDALSLIVSGFFEPFTKELPFEYAVELNRLIQLEMEGSVG